MKQPEPRTSTVRTLGVDWAAHGSLARPYGQPLCGVVGLWAVQAQGRRPKDERIVDGPLEDLVFLNYCNLLVFLGWAKIVAI